MPGKKVLLTTFNPKNPFELGISPAPLLLKYNALKSPDIARVCDIDIFEFKLEDDPDYIITKILEYRPDIIGFSCYMWNLNRTLSLLPRIKKSTGAMTILGGPETGPDAINIITRNPDADIIVRYEGEETFADLLSTIITGRSLAKVQGITYRENGSIKNNRDRIPIESLDSLPNIYSEINEPLHGKVVYFEGSRGCTNRCNYCDFNRHGGKIRFFGIDRLKEDLGHLLKSKIFYIHWTDSILNTDKKRLREICDFIFANNPYGVQSQISVDAQRIDDETARLFAKAKMNLIDIGIQSTDPSVLEKCRRRTDFEKVRKSIRILRKHNFSIVMHLIFGLPGDKWEIFRKSLKDTLKFDPDGLAIFRLHVLPGTEIWKRASDMGIEFESNPPYRILKSPAVTFEDLVKFDIFERNFRKFFHSKFARMLCKDIGCDLVDLCELWIDFLRDEDELMVKEHDHFFLENIIPFIKRLSKTYPKIRSDFYLAIIGNEFSTERKGTFTRTRR